MSPLIRGNSFVTLSDDDGDSTGHTSVLFALLSTSWNIVAGMAVASLMSWLPDGDVVVREESVGYGFV